jgi:hypothetical protein
VQEVRYFSPPIARVFPVGLESQMLETALFEVAALALVYLQPQ